MSSLKGDVLDFSVKSQIEETANDSDKTFVVPAGKLWKMLSIYVHYTATADVGNRFVNIQIIDPDTKVVFYVRAAAQVASAQIWYVWVPALSPDDNASNYMFYGPLPSPCILPPGWSIHIWDESAIQPAADDMLCYLIYGEADI